MSGSGRAQITPQEHALLGGKPSGQSHLNPTHTHRRRAAFIPDVHPTRLATAPADNRRVSPGCVQIRIDLSTCSTTTSARCGRSAKRHRDHHMIYRDHIDIIKSSSLAYIWKRHSLPTLTNASISLASTSSVTGNEGRQERTRRLALGRPRDYRHGVLVIECEEHGRRGRSSTQHHSVTSTHKTPGQILSRERRSASSYSQSRV